MDRVKTGKLIAQLRSEKHLSQEELSEKVGASGKTVSAWERGISFPSLEKADRLCHILGISFNDLVQGEIISEDDRMIVAENNLAVLRSVCEELLKTLFKMEQLLSIICMIFIISMAVILFTGHPSAWWKAALDIAAMAIAAAALVLLKRMDLSVGYYICPQCGASCKPLWIRQLLSLRKGRSRWFRCPHCGKRQWLVKVIEPEQPKQK